MMPLISGIGLGSVQIYLGLGLRPLPIFVVSSLALFIYAFNRVTDHEEDLVNVSGSADALYRSAVLQTAIAGALLAVASAYAIWLGRFHWIYAAILAMGVVYSYRILPWYRPGRGIFRERLKAIPSLKNPSIALAWSLSIFVVPLYDSHRGLGAASPAFWLLATGYFFYYFLNTVFCDLRDIEGDRAAGVVTLANALGVAGCYRWIAALTLVWCGAIASIAASTRWLDGSHAAFLIAASLAYPLSVILMRETIRNSDWIINVTIELAGAVYAIGIVALVWAAKHGLRFFS